MPDVRASQRDRGHVEGGLGHLVFNEVTELRIVLFPDRIELVKRVDPNGHAAPLQEALVGSVRLERRALELMIEAWKRRSGA